MKHYDADAVNNLKVFNSKTCVGKYKIKITNGHVVIDNTEGLGNSKTTREVFIKGFLASLDSEMFKALYESFEGKDLPTADIPNIENGSALANPIIFYDVEAYFESKTKGPKIVGFDNIENAAALINANSATLPVQVVLVGYGGSVKRSDAEFRNWCGRNVQVNNKVVKEPYAQVIFK